MVFEGFTTEDLTVGDAVIHVRHARRGKAVLLLHGQPRTGATWHRVAPALVELGFRVVVPDLRGYGASRGPDPAADHAPASKRAMGRDLVAVMDALGVGRFSIAGHDRGSYVAYRMAMQRWPPVRVSSVERRRYRGWMEYYPSPECRRRGLRRFSPGPEHR